MKNYICEGDRLNVVAGSGGIVSGALHVIGTLGAVALASALEDETYVAAICGVFEVPKASGAVTQGAKLYFDATNKVATTTATSNTLIGYAYEDAASGDATVNVILNCP